MTDVKNGPLYNGASAGISTRTKIWTISQAVVGPLVVAGVIWLINDRNSAWDRLDAIVHDHEIHVVEGLRKHEILERRLDIKRKELDEMDDALRQTQLDMQRLWIEFAKLPPNEWQQRILRNERDITVLKSKEER